MVKKPLAGRVKTRLGREIGTVQATAFYRHAAMAVIRRLAASTRWQTWLAVAPDEARRVCFSQARVPRRAQGRGDLGTRMQRIMDWPCRGPIIIVGTDIPAIEARHVGSAFRALASGNAVLGPTPDGGYWLVGLARTPRIAKPFSNVRWSSEHAYADTSANLRGLRQGHAPVLADVDDREGWSSTRGWSGRVVLPLSVRQSSP